MGENQTKVAFLAIAAASLCGCASLSPGEIAVQSLHAVDVAQTVKIAKNPTKYQEAGYGMPFLIGAHPSEARVIEWGAVSGIAHYAVDDYLYQHNHPKVAMAFEAVSIAFVADTVHHNYSIGLGYGFR